MAKGKGFISEFKTFIMRGNVIDLAVGVIIGGAFGSVVSGLTDNIIQPLLNCIGGAEVQGKIRLFGTENFLDYGAFISSIINFLIIIRCLAFYIYVEFVLVFIKRNYFTLAVRRNIYTTQCFIEPIVFVSFCSKRMR